MFRRNDLTLARLSRRLEKMQRRCANRGRTGLKIARMHGRSSGCRSELLHKLSIRLIIGGQKIVIEGLSVRNMHKTGVCRNQSAVQTGPNSGDNRNTRHSRMEHAGRYRPRVSIQSATQYLPAHRIHVVDGGRAWTCPRCGANSRCVNSDA